MSELIRYAFITCFECDPRNAPLKRILGPCRCPNCSRYFADGLFISQAICFPDITPKLSALHSSNLTGENKSEK